MFSFYTKVSNKINSSYKFKTLPASRRKLTRSLAFKLICCHFSYFGKMSSIGESMWFESHGAACNRCYFPFMLSHSNKITALYIPSNIVYVLLLSVFRGCLTARASYIYICAACHEMSQNSICASCNYETVLCLSDLYVSLLSGNSDIIKAYNFLCLSSFFFCKFIKSWCCI